MKTFAEFLEREAGNIITGMALILLGAILWRCGVPKAEDLIPFALGVIGRSMIAGKKESDSQ